MEEMSSNNRDHTIDILKGVSIGAIMLLHYEQGIFPDWLNVWIGSFMISAFYFTSGWVQGKKPEPTFRGLLQKRWKSIGLPYLWFSGLLIIVSIIFLIFGHYDSRIVLRDIYKTFTLRGIGTLWFLPAIYGGEILAWKFRQDGLLGRVILCLSSLVFLIFYSYWDRTCGHLSDFWRLLDAPLRTVSNIANAWLPIVLGYYLSKHGRYYLETISVGEKAILGIAVLTWFTLIVLGYPTGTECLLSTLGPFGLFILFQTTPYTKLHCYLSWFGRNSLVVMATHYSITQELCIIINRHWGAGTQILEGWWALGFFLASIPVEVALVCFFDRYLPFFLGKGALNQ